MPIKFCSSFLLLNFISCILLDLKVLQQIRPQLSGKRGLLRQGTLFGKVLLPYVRLSTKCGLDEFITVQILLILYQKPILQLVDNCTFGTIAFPCSLVKMTGKQWPNLIQQHHQFIFVKNFRNWCIISLKTKKLKLIQKGLKLELLKTVLCNLPCK